MQAKHIAIILHDFSSGGSERIAIRLANEWAARGRRVMMLCGTEEGAVRQLVAPEIEVQGCTPVTRRSPWSRLQLGWRLAALVRKHKPDIVFAPGNFHMIVLAVLGRMPIAPRPAFVCKISNPFGRSGGRNAFNKALAAVVRHALAPIDMLIAMSSSLKNEALAYAGTTPVAQIEEPVLGDSEVVVARRCDGRAGPLILCIGRLEPQKDFLTAIRAFAQLDPALDARLVILGEGAQRSRLEAEIVRLGLGHSVSLPGYVTDTQPFFARADLLLMTSRFEGYPAVLIEALAAGLAIVTTPCSPAIGEIVTTPELGIVTDSHEPSRLAEAIATQLAQPKPRPETSASLIARHRIGPSATAYLELFDRVAA